MQESARAAQSYVWSHAEQLGIDPDLFRQAGVHIHVPAGAVPKDGPSAGVAMVTALASLYTGLPVRSDTAMTGEITLTGLVLPVGGIKEKVLAARRAGIRRVILPKDNEKDLRELPEDVRREMEFVPGRADRGGAPGGHPRAGRTARRRGRGPAEPGSRSTRQSGSEHEAQARHEAIHMINKLHLHDGTIRPSLVAELEAYRSPQGRVSSYYLNIDPHRWGNTEAIKIAIAVRASRSNT